MPAAMSPDAVLDDFHAAAAAADGDRYFRHFAKDGVFLGTDASERWTVDEFKAYATPYFSKGQGWTYVSQDRWLDRSDDGQYAWFDEVLANEAYGLLRGSGVLRRTDDGWKIVQYNLAFLIPNEKAKAVVGVIAGR